MKICVTQRDGIRYFTRFADLAERDKLTVELSLEDKNGKTITIDLTSALVQEYSKHPELGKIDPNAVQILCAQPIKALKVKQTREVKPAYLTEPQKQRQDMLSKVRQAQLKAVDERKKREAEIAEARALRLAAARKAKAEKEQAAASKVAKQKPAPAKAKATTTKSPAKPVKAAAKAVTAAPKNGSKPSAKDKAAAAGLSKVQAAAIKKIGSALAKEEKAAKVVSKVPAGKPKPTAEKPRVAAKAARNK